jgi:hypothetical protein
LHLGYFALPPLSVFQPPLAASSPPRLLPLWFSHDSSISSQGVGAISHGRAHLPARSSPTIPPTRTSISPSYCSPRNSLLASSPSRVGHHRCPPLRAPSAPQPSHGGRPALCSHFLQPRPPCSMASGPAIFPHGALPCSSLLGQQLGRPKSPMLGALFHLWPTSSAQRPFPPAICSAHRKPELLSPWRSAGQGANRPLSFFSHGRAAVLHSALSLV